MNHRKKKTKVETQGFYPNYSVTSCVLAVGVFSLLTVALSWLNERSRRIRSFTTGVAQVVVADGESVLATLRAERISIDDLMSAAREGGIERFDKHSRRRAGDQRSHLLFTRDHAADGAPEPPTAG